MGALNTQISSPYFVTRENLAYIDLPMRCCNFSHAPRLALKFEFLEAPIL